VKDRFYLKPEIGIALLAIVLGGFFRLYHLGLNSLGSDEAIIYWCSTVFLQHIKPIIIKYLYHPLFMYYVYNIFRWEETPEWLLRIIPAFIGILTIWMEYKIGSLLLGEKGGAISALIISLSPFHIFVSQYFPIYSPMIFFVLGSMYYFTLMFLGDTRLRCCLLYILFSGISFNIHYMTIIFILLQNLLVLFLSRIRQCHLQEIPHYFLTVQYAQDL
jgi:4-amino-4-deoxy-L-arabinose transferase-like glycosyltransferase